MKWLGQRDLAADGVRLFCLPHAGSGSAAFHRWKRLLPAGVAVCPVMLPGREARLGEPCLHRVEEIVQQLHAEAAPLLDRPYAIFGHSMGSLLAYEWTRRIQAEGLRPPMHLFVSGRNAPQWASGHSGLHALDEYELVRELRARYGGSPGALLENAELREIFLPILRADLGVVESYAYVSGAALPCPVTALAGVLDHSVSDDGLAGWSEVTAATFEWQRLAGDHFYPFSDGQQELLALIADRLA